MLVFSGKAKPRTASLPACRFLRLLPLNAHEEVAVKAASTLALLALLGMATVLQAQPALAPPQPATATAEHPLLVLNQASRAIYAQSRARALAEAKPVIILMGDRLILDTGEKRLEASFASRPYDDLKTFAHIGLALDTALMGLPEDGRLSDELVEQLLQYKALIQAAASEISNLDLNEDQAARQHKIATAAIAFINRLADQRQCTSAQRQAFIRSLTPLVMANVAEAAEATLETIDGVVQQWKRELSPEQWQRLRVIVMGRQLPRKDSLAVQYFAWLLNVPGEGERIIYAEGIPDEEGALKLLGTHLIDTQVGIDFFDDPARMRRDLLGDAARETLKRWSEKR